MPSGVHNSPRGGKPSPEKQALDSRPCRFCGAVPGQGCKPTQGSKMAHADRVRKQQQHEIEVARHG